MASLLGGGIRKQTEGTMASFPVGLITFHLVLWELSSRTHSSFLQMVICNSNNTSSPSESSSRDLHACPCCQPLSCGEPAPKNTQMDMF